MNRARGERRSPRQAPSGAAADTLPAGSGDSSFGGAADRPIVSVVIPARNERRHIETCLASVVQQDYPADRLEVIVVDGRSDDGTRQWLMTEMKQRWPQVIVLDNSGRSAARGLNIGIREAKGQVLILLSAHAVVAPDFVTANVDALEETGADVTGGPLETVGEGLVGEAIALALSNPFGAADSLFRYSQREQWVQSVAFGAYRRRVFERTGVFDETLPRCIDDDFNYRLVDNGGKLWLTPRVKSRYYSRSSFATLFRQYLNSGTWKTEVLRKQPRQTRLRHLGPGLFVAATAVTAVLSPFRRQFAVPFLLLLGVYAAVSLIVSALIAARKGVRYFLLLPLAFACIHFGYGLGLWRGIWETLLGRRRRQQPGP